MKNIIYKVLFLGVFFMVACTKDAEIPLPEYQKKLVIHCYISPVDSGVTVNLNWSRPAYNNTGSLQFVADADVRISNGIDSVKLTYISNPNLGVYPYYYIDSNAFKILPGKTYYLWVKTIEGTIATASTTVPTKLHLQTLVTSREVGQFSDSIYKLNFTFIDAPGADDYYKYGGYVLEIDTVIGDTQSFSSNEKYGVYFTSDGSLIQENMELYYSTWFQPESIRMIDFRLFHVSKEYYLYHQSIQYGGGGGPFTEPNIVYTNVTGGVGVFASYNIDKRLYRP